VERKGTTADVGQLGLVIFLPAAMERRHSPDVNQAPGYRLYTENAQCATVNWLYYR